MKKNVKTILIFMLATVFIFSLATVSFAKNIPSKGHGSKDKRVTGESKVEIEVSDEEEKAEQDVEKNQELKERKQEMKEFRNMMREQLGEVKSSLKEGDFEGALQRIEELKKVYGESDILLEERAKVFESIGKVEESIKSFEEAVKLNPCNKELYKELGNVYRKAGKEELKVFVQGMKPQFDQPPVIKEGRTLVPVRAITEALGATVEYDPETKEVTITKDGKTVILKLDSKTAVIDGEEVELEVPAKAINARTVIPLRFVSEAFGAEVDYDGENEIITIIEEEEEELDVEENTDETSEDDANSEEDNTADDVEITVE